MRAAVIGAGSWGTALASVLGANGHDTLVWSHDPEVAAAITRHPGLRGAMHYFALEWDWAERFLDLGFYLSFAGLITRPSRAALRDVVKRCPADRLLLETDSPHGNAHKRMGVPNRPAYLLDTAELAADLRGITISQLAELEFANALALFTRIE